MLRRYCKEGGKRKKSPLRPKNFLKSLNEQTPHCLARSMINISAMRKHEEIPRAPGAPAIDSVASCKTRVRSSSLNRLSIPLRRLATCQCRTKHHVDCDVPRIVPLSLGQISAVPSAVQHTFHIVCRKLSRLSAGSIWKQQVIYLIKWNEKFSFHSFFNCLDIFRGHY